MTRSATRYAAGRAYERVRRFCGYTSAHVVAAVARDEHHRSGPCTSLGFLCGAYAGQSIADACYPLPWALVCSVLERTRDGTVGALFDDNQRGLVFGNALLREVARRR